MDFGGSSGVHDQTLAGAPIRRERPGRSTEFVRTVWTLRSKSSVPVVKDQTGGRQARRCEVRARQWNQGAAPAGWNNSGTGSNALGKPEYQAVFEVGNRARLRMITAFVEDVSLSLQLAKAMSLDPGIWILRRDLLNVLSNGRIRIG